jgi:glycosyltransferase involved in cell wall biosynthesis
MSCFPAITQVGIVLPVHNEEDLLPGVLDQCTDRTAEIVSEHTTGYAAGERRSVRVLTSSARSVGAARGAGMAALLDHLGSDGLWLTTTDADSKVPADWLVRQLAHHAAGADVVLGTVEVADWSDHPAAVPLRHARQYRSRYGHHHVHGANLALSAHAYLAVGGFAAVSADEDVLLVRALQTGGWRMAWVPDMAVTTSARRIGRAPAGFARHLRELAPEPAVRLPPVTGVADVAAG